MVAAAAAGCGNVEAAAVMAWVTGVEKAAVDRVVARAVAAELAEVGMAVARAAAEVVAWVAAARVVVGMVGVAKVGEIPALPHACTSQLGRACMPPRLAACCDIHRGMGA